MVACYPGTEALQSSEIGMMNMTNLKIFIISIFFVSITIISFSNPAYGEEKKPSSIEETLIRLEEGQKAINQRIDATNKRIDDMNKRIDDLRQDMNSQIGGLRQDMNSQIGNLRQNMNERFADLHFWLQIIFGAVVLVIAGLIAQWLLMWQRLIGVETKVKEHLAETEKDRLIVFQREEIEMLKARLDKLEAGSG